MVKREYREKMTSKIVLGFTTLEGWFIIFCLYYCSARSEKFNANSRNVKS